MTVNRLKRSTETLYLMDTVADFLPRLKKARGDGEVRVVPYRFAKLLGTKRPSVAYEWLNGSRRPSYRNMLQLVYEILAVAKRERKELEELRARRKG